MEDKDRSTAQASASLGTDIQLPNELVFAGRIGILSRPVATRLILLQQELRAAKACGALLCHRGGGASAFARLGKLAVRHSTTAQDLR